MKSIESLVEARCRFCDGPVWWDGDPNPVHTDCTEKAAQRACLALGVIGAGIAHALTALVSQVRYDMLQRALAGLEVAVVEPRRARAIIRTLHDEIAEVL